MQQAHGADHKYSSSRARVRGLSFCWHQQQQKQKNNLFSPHLIAMVFKVRWD